ncbi:myosin light chain 4 isoform X2 [Mustela putorius furo]|uniref:Myosin light chain 4 isoform X2 n=1 Tax=Mustela putorius furo TaxID=9669 RepID=A0A8U0S7H6_MUSPF|nr:myosin light chain 4 isoform X2 [Mustela putorius furo]
MGEAERLPSTSERDTEIPEVERSARELDGKARRRPETPEAGRRRRRPLPETVEVSRRLPSPIQSVVFSSRPRLQSRTPRPTGHPRLGHAQWAARRMGVACCSWRGALRGRTIDRLHSPLNLCGSVDARLIHRAHATNLRGWKEGHMRQIARKWPSTSCEESSHQKPKWLAP